jgi:hypothetical protein
MLQKIVNHYQDEEILKADGFDEAVVGIDSSSMRLIYSVRLCIEILVEEGMDMIDAVEHFDYNVRDSYVGEKTPIWCDDMFEQ